MFEHLGKLSKRREEDGYEQDYDHRQRALDPIREEVNDDSGIKGKFDDESAEVNSQDEGITINKPGETQARRGTVRTEISERDMDFEPSSTDGDEADQHPWVDKVQLRHGMDWLDLITDEVDRETMRYGDNIRGTQLTRATK